MKGVSRRVLRSISGVVFGLAGLGVAWWLIVSTLASLSPATVKDLFSHQWFSVIAIIAALGIIYFAGTVGMWIFDALSRPRHSASAVAPIADSGHNDH